jgi:hypothetical protein
MVNGIILEMMEAMTLQEFQQWAEETGWSFWAQIMTPEEARGYRNTLALTLAEEGPDGEVGKAPFNVTQNRIGSIKSRLWELLSWEERRTAAAAAPVSCRYC